MFSSTPEARDGQVVVARLDGELTIKRLSRTADVLRLLPRNPAYAPIEVRPGQDFAIACPGCRNDGSKQERPRWRQ